MKKYIVSLCLFFSFFSTVVLAADKSTRPSIVMNTNCKEHFTIRPADASEQFKIANEAVNIGQFEEARKIYERLAQVGLFEAMKHLSSMYAAGLGVQKDKIQAKKWQQEAERAIMIDAVCINQIHSTEDK